MPRVIKVIESHISRGSGLQKGEIKYRGGTAQHKLLRNDSVRSVIQYHTEDGEFLAEVDPRHELIIQEFKRKEEKNQ